MFEHVALSLLRREMTVEPGIHRELPKGGWSEEHLAKTRFGKEF